MSIKKVMRDVAIDRATKQTKLVDNLTEEAPLLQMMPVEAATHGWSNVYEKLVNITPASLVDLDDELPEMDATTKLVQEDLSVLGGTMYVGTDKAKKFGGPAPYFNKKLPAILRETGSQTENSLIYNNFEPFAINNGKVIDVEGSSNTNYSILCVKWVPGEITGLFDEEGFGSGQGKMLQSVPLWGGKVGKKRFTFADSTEKEISVYGSDWKTYFGLQLANDRYVSTMVNIDIDSATEKFPTEKQMNQLINEARGNNGGSTFLYMHPNILTELFRYKSAHLEVQVQTENMDFRFTSWNGVPIITSYNFDEGTEANV
jgi:hypothetical protein